jgi:hypothetical protein
MMQMPRHTVVATDLLEDTPRELWRDLMLARRQVAETRIEEDCRFLLQFCNDADAMFEALGFEDPAAMIRDGLGIDPEQAQLIVGWLDRQPQSEPVSFASAKVMALAAHGGDRRSEEFQVRDTNLKPSTDTRDYILARLERDGHHDLAEDVRAGNISANRAAVTVGIRRQRTPFEIVLAQLGKLKQDERARLMELLEEASVTPHFCARDRHNIAQRLIGA